MIRTRHVANAQAAARVLATWKVDAVIHCGDIGSLDIVPVFAPWPTHYVLGNVDDNQAALAAAIRASGQTFHGPKGDITLDGVRIAFMHGHNERLLRESIESGAYQLVCYGHTHLAEHHQQGATWVLNPGALYRANPHTLAIVELPDITIHRLPL